MWALYGQMKGKHSVNAGRPIGSNLPEGAGSGPTWCWQTAELALHRTQSWELAKRTEKKHSVSGVLCNLTLMCYVSHPTSGSLGRAPRSAEAQLQPANLDDTICVLQFRSAVLK